MAGCTRYVIGQSYYDPETEESVERTEELSEEGRPKVDERLEEILHRHGYEVYSAFGQSQHLIMIADVHTIPVRLKHNKLLKELITKKDVLFIEGYLVGNANPVLEKEFFAAVKLPREKQEEIRLAALANRYEKDLDKPYSYFNQGFVGELDSCENDTFVAAHYMARYSSNEVSVARAIHCRNVAMADIIEKKINASLEKTFYLPIGNQHVLPLDFFRSVGVPRKSIEFEKTVGELPRLLQKNNVPYVVVVSEDIVGDIEREALHPETQINKD